MDLNFDFEAEKRCDLGKLLASLKTAPSNKETRFASQASICRGEMVGSWEGIFFLRCFFYSQHFFSGSFMGQESTS